MLAKEYTAAELANLGVINAAVPAEQLDARVDEMVEGLLRRSSYALAWTKRVANKHLSAQLQLRLDASVAYELVNILQLSKYGDQLHLCRDMEISTEWVGDDSYHQRIEAVLRSTDAQGSPLEWRVTGDVLNLIPLRNRRDGLVTRISEGLTQWTLADGRVGYGLSEYLDQIVDGQPVGLDE